MKKLLPAALCLIAMTSCYNTRLIVGNVKPNEPLIKVSSEWNHHFLYGLVPLDNATMKTEEYVDGHPNYVVRTYTSFLNGFVSSLTCGIYTPTQTAYYLPLRALHQSAADTSDKDIIDLIED